MDGTAMEYRQSLGKTGKNTRKKTSFDGMKHIISLKEEHHKLLFL
jgi:hypothetical protein